MKTCTGAIFFFFFLLSEAALPLPKYAKPCARNDPNWNECVLRSAREVVPNILKGDRKYNIPVLTPLEVTEIQVENKGPRQAGISITLRDSKIYGIENSIIQSLSMDLEKKKCFIEVTFPRLEIVGQYEISGRILVLPITGKGPQNTTIISAHAEFEADLSVGPKDDGEVYFEITNSKFRSFVPTRAYFELHNLFGGDKLLGREMNIFLNRNWKDAFQELSPPVIEAMSQVISSIINNIANLVPYDVAFPRSL